MYSSQWQPFFAFALLLKSVSFDWIFRLLPLCLRTLHAWSWFGASVVLLHYWHYGPADLVLWLTMGNWSRCTLQDMHEDAASYGLVGG
jgi:hypothetical protein